MKILIIIVSVLIFLSLAVFIQKNTKNNWHYHTLPAIPELPKDNISDINQTTTIMPVAATASLTQPAKKAQNQLLDTGSTKTHLLSTDDTEQVWIDEANQQLVVKDIQTNAIIYQLPLSSELIAINLSSEVRDISEFNNAINLIGNNPSKANEPLTQVEDKLEIFYNQESPDEIILHHNGIDEFIPTDQLEDIINLIDPNAHSSIDTQSLKTLGKFSR